MFTVELYAKIGPAVIVDRFMGRYRPAAAGKYDSCADKRTSDDMIKVLVNWRYFIRCRLMIGNAPLTYMRDIVFHRDYH